MSLPSRFSIYIDGRPVAIPQEPQENHHPIFDAQAGNPGAGTPPAVFEVQEGQGGIQLVSGSYALGRFQVEDMSLMPKRVGWCKRDEAQMLQPIHVRNEGNGPELSFSGMLMSGQLRTLCLIYYNRCQIGVYR